VERAGTEVADIGKSLTGGAAPAGHINHNNRRNTDTGQIGDGREAAAVDYVLGNARAGDIDDALTAIDRFAYQESMLINFGDDSRRADAKVP
jgi:hypothetical protein